ncbi:hypothetical protein BN2127_JRS9_04023 [Bacillus subtilis]|uniref:hypothetical protein n=1 Tax=Bacillus subtilis TaxID=1423 RepID=UPI0006A867A5|nr:hypothetical protein [Bacillus subtilis]CUB13681.1 hypothetical protein BN2127_JRS2_00490 [Bacillus subtilis]CUB59397.1 hypothetical protein BN2127_JRS9_04023 [Bacillus subtilis]
MKINLKYWSIAAVLGISLFDFMGASKVQAAEVKAPSSIEAKILSKNEIESKKEEIASQIKIFDENNNEIQPYTLKELKDMITLKEEMPLEGSLHALYSTYTSKAFSFKYNFPIGGGTYGKAFKNPGTLLITPEGTAKKFSVIAKYDNGKGGVGGQAGRVSLPGGWRGEIHMNWTQLKRGKSYHFIFDNDSSSDVTVKIKKVVVWYNW